MPDQGTRDGPDDHPPRQVLWLIKGLGPGGAEQLLTLSARFHDHERWPCRALYLLPWKDALVDDLRLGGVEVECLGAASSWDARWLWRLRRSLTAHPVDVVHSHSPLAAIGARLVARTVPRGRRPRLVSTDHNLWDSYARPTALVHGATAPLDDAHLAVSEAVRASMPGSVAQRTEVVRYGIDVEAVRASARSRRDVRAELGVDEDDVVIVTVANLRATKGYPDLLRAARRVLDDVPVARFVAIGQGPMEAEIRALHDSLDLGERFRLLGYRRDAVGVMSACDIFCLASRHEGLPVAIMEALALGLPVVATRVGGVPELVTDGRDAVLVPPGDQTALVDALRALATDPARRRELGAAARQRAADLSVEGAVRRIEEVYGEVLAR